MSRIYLYSKGQGWHSLNNHTILPAQDAKYVYDPVYLKLQCGIWMSKVLKVFYLNEVLIDTRIFIIKSHILIHFLNLFLFLCNNTIFCHLEVSYTNCYLVMFRLLFFSKKNHWKSIKSITSDLIVPKWWGRGNKDSKILIEALLSSVGFTYVLNFESSLDKKTTKWLSYLKNLQLLFQSKNILFKCARVALKVCSRFTKMSWFAGRRPQWKNCREKILEFLFTLNTGDFMSFIPEVKGKMFNSVEMRSVLPLKMSIF